MKCYIDSSALLRSILRSDDSLEPTRACDRVASSELLEIECARVLQRYRLEGLLDDEQYVESASLLSLFASSITIIPIAPAILRRAAGPFPTVIGTLDAIHLASALLWQEAENTIGLRILTFDRQLAICAKAMGIEALN